MLVLHVSKTSPYVAISPALRIPLKLNPNNIHVLKCQATTLPWFPTCNATYTSKTTSLLLMECMRTCTCVVLVRRTASPVPCISCLSVFSTWTCSCSCDVITTICNGYSFATCPMLPMANARFRVFLNGRFVEGGLCHSPFLTDCDLVTHPNQLNTHVRHLLAFNLQHNKLYECYKSGLIYQHRVQINRVPPVN